SGGRGESRAAISPGFGRLELTGKRVQNVLCSAPAYELDAQRQAVRAESGRDRDRRLAGQVERGRPWCEPGRDGECHERRPTISPFRLDRCRGETGRHQHVDLVPELEHPAGDLVARGDQPRAPPAKQAPRSKVMARVALELRLVWDSDRLLIYAPDPHLREADRGQPVGGIALHDLVSELGEPVAGALPRRSLIA